MRVDIWITVGWIFTPCTLMGTFESFERIRCLPLQYRGVLGECSARLYREDFLSDYLPYHSNLVLHTKVGTLIVATIYLQPIQNRYMFRSFTVLHCSHQHCVQPVASDVEVVGYL